jgi:hypothetical protein
MEGCACVSITELNKITVEDKCPIPRVDELFDCLGGQRTFPVLTCGRDITRFGFERRMSPKPVSA